MDKKKIAETFLIYLSMPLFMLYLAIMLMGVGAMVGEGTQVTMPYFRLIAQAHLAVMILTGFLLAHLLTKERKE